MAERQRLDYPSKSMTEMNCPKDGMELEPFSGDFGTGVYAPDGHEEHYWVDGLICPRCGTVYEPAELESVNDARRSPESVRPEPYHGAGR